MSPNDSCKRCLSAMPTPLHFFCNLSSPHCFCVSAESETSLSPLVGNFPTANPASRQSHLPSASYCLHHHHNGRWSIILWPRPPPLLRDIPPPPFPPPLGHNDIQQQRSQFSMMGVLGVCVFCPRGPAHAPGPHFWAWQGPSSSPTQECGGRNYSLVASQRCVFVSIK